MKEKLNHTLDGTVQHIYIINFINIIGIQISKVRFFYLKYKKVSTKLPKTKSHLKNSNVIKLNS